MIVSAKSSTSAGGLASAATGMRPTRCGASQAMARRSLRTSVPTCGRCTLTTTGSPVRRRAACTWAIDAAASGVRSNHSKMASRVAPRSALHDRAHVVERLGRHLVAAELELVDQLLREQPLAGGDDLAELDVGRAEVLGRLAQPPRDVGPAGLGVGEAPAPLLHHPRPEGGGQPARHPNEAGAGRHAARGGEPGHRSAGLGAQGGHEGAPRHGVEVQHPRRVVAERAPGPIVDRHRLGGRRLHRADDRMQAATQPGAGRPRRPRR